MALLVGPMGVEGLALALSISSVLEVIGLLWYLRRRIESVDEAAIVRSGRAIRALPALAAALLMLGGLTVVEASLGGLLDNAVGTAARAARPLGRRRRHLPAGRGRAARAGARRSCAASSATAPVGSA